MSRRAFFTIILLLLVFGTSGCGKKAPPLAQTAVDLPVAVSIETRIQEGFLYLSWGIEGDMAGSKLAGFRVERAIFRCTGCPKRFEAVAQVSFEPGRERMAYQEKLDQHRNKVFRLIPFDEIGRTGTPVETPVEY